MKKTSLQPFNISRREFINSMAMVLGISISSDSEQMASGRDLGSIVAANQEHPWVRTLEDNRMYTLKLHSKWYQQGDLVVAELEPHVPLQDSTFNFYAKRADGTTRRLGLPQLNKDGRIFVFLGIDYTYPAQNATLELKISSRRETIDKSYHIGIKKMENVREQHFSSAATQNAEPRTPEDERSAERERDLLYPSWEDYTAKSSHITGTFQLPRPVCDFGSFGARRIYDGKERSRHNGLDCTGDIGDAIRAALPGKVVLSKDGFFYMGNSVVVQHGFGLYTLYAHLNRRNVREGEIVSSGQPIGEIGRSGRVTGPHLHWQAKLYGMNMDPKSLEVLNDVFK